MDRLGSHLDGPEFELSEKSHIGPLPEPEACGGAATASTQLAHAGPRFHAPKPGGIAMLAETDR